MKRIFAGMLTFLIFTVAIGYFIGDYFLGYALKRGTAEDPKAMPPACAAIADPSLVPLKKPLASEEGWEISSADGLALRAVHLSPSGSSHRWAILVHGYGRTKEFTWDYAEEYLKQGYHVLAPDLRAAGESEGTYITMGTKESEDIALWAERIAREDPEARIVLHGVSMGAATVMMASALRPSHVVAVVEDCGYTNAYDMFTMQLKVLFGLPEFPVMQCLDAVSRMKTGCAVSDANPLKSVARTDLPMLFIHGDADRLVPCGMMQELLDASSSPKKEAVTVIGAGHASAKNADPEKYFSKIFSFLEPYMQ